MHVQAIVTSLQAALVNTAALADGDPAVEAATQALADAIAPALRVAAMDLAEQAAAEVRAQLPEHTVDLVLADGDPALRIGERDGAATPRPAEEDFGARITLRLPPSLKNLIEDAAATHGESVNAWVVEALGKRARGGKTVGKTFNQAFDL